MSVLAAIDDWPVDTSAVGITGPIVFALPCMAPRRVLQRLGHVGHEVCAASLQRAQPRHGHMGHSRRINQAAFFSGNRVRLNVLAPQSS